MALREQGKTDQCKLLQRRAHEIQTASREKTRASRTEFEAKDPDWDGGYETKGSYSDHGRLQLQLKEQQRKEMEEDDGIPQLLTSEEANRRFSRGNGCGGFAVVGRGRGESKVAGGAMDCIMLE